MKLRIIILLTSLILIETIYNSCIGQNHNTKIEKDGWELDWQDDFNKGELDTTHWSIIPRGTIAWNNKMSSSDSCYSFRKSSLILRGIKNNRICKKDTSKYLTGGIWSKNKYNFKPGRFEIKARMTAAVGAWPAIWLGASNKDKPWPLNGEIDIMEHFHHKPMVCQTLHSNYSLNINKAGQQNHVKVPVKANDFNIYGVDILEDSIIFHVNGYKTLTYTNDKDLNSELGQFPFFQDWYILIDMQLGGNNVGPIKDSELPVEMEIDWVKHYIRKE